LPQFSMYDKIIEDIITLRQKPSSIAMDYGVGRIPRGSDLSKGDAPKSRERDEGEGDKRLRVMNF